MIDKVIKYLERLNLPTDDVEILDTFDGYVTIRSNNLILDISRESLLFKEKKG